MQKLKRNQLKVIAKEQGNQLRNWIKYVLKGNLAQQVN
jgi:hypothetical protein